MFVFFINKPFSAEHNCFVIFWRAVSSGSDAVS